MKRAEPWFKCYPADWLEATRGLTLEQRAVYFDCLCLIYEFGRPLPDDDKWVSHQLHISTRLWRSIRDALIRVGKLVKTEDGLTNPRAHAELSSRSTRRRSSAEPAVKQARTRREKSKKPNEFYARARACQISDIRYQKENIISRSQEAARAQAQEPAEVVVNGTAIKGPWFRLDYAAIDMTAALAGMPPDRARQIAEVVARDWVANGIRPANPMAVVKAAILADKRQSEVHEVRLEKAAAAPALAATPAPYDRAAPAWKVERDRQMAEFKQALAKFQ